MKKEATFKGSGRTGGFYATAIFTTKEKEVGSITKEELRDEASSFQDIFETARLRTGDFNRTLKTQVIGNRVILQIVYIPGSTITDDWDSRIKSDAENIVDQLELRLSHID